MTDPVAIQLGPLSIRWYGVFVALGFLAGYQLAQRRSRALGLAPQVAADITLAAMVGGIVGARVLYVSQNWDEFSLVPWEAVAIWRGGLVFYGGFLGALAAVVFWSWRKGWPLLSIGDMVAPALPLGHALGRIGCLLNGCCFGFRWQGPCGIVYPGFTADGAVNGPLYVQRLLHWLPTDGVTCLPVFPIQAVDAAGNLAVCLLLLRCGRRPRWRGQLFPLYLLLYPAMRFMVEFGRGDYLVRSGGLTSAQWLCLLLFAVAVFWLAWNHWAGLKLKPDNAAAQDPDERR
jgi:phosphatidylglycerol:prolipoprotein diacylglycerol transferase